MQEHLTENKAMNFAKWLIDKSIKGIPPLTSADNLAKEYLIDVSYPSNEARCDSLINWETAKNATTGFLTGLGGLITMPVSIPAAFGASYIIQARMAGAIAVIYGHDINEDRVRTLVLLSLLGDAAKEPLKQAGIKVSQKLAYSVIDKIPAKALMEINKRVGFRLITMAGEDSVINIAKCVPAIGGVVGGVSDAIAFRTVGYTAQRIFKGHGQAEDFLS